MNRTRGLWLLAVLGCGPTQGDPENPSAPRLAAPLTYVQANYSDSTALFGIEGRLEMTVQPGGEAEASVKPPILTGVYRKGRVSGSTLAEHARSVQEWTASADSAPGVPADTGSLLTYGERKAQWGRRTTLSPPLSRLRTLLEEIARTLPEVRTR